MIIFDIIEGYFNLIRFNLDKKYREKQKILFNKRLSICENCKYLKKNKCDICGCLVKAKTKVIYKLDEKGNTIKGCSERYW